MPPVIRHSTATSAPEELQMGEEMDSSIYRRPMYPMAMDEMYSSDTGRYVQMISQVTWVPPIKISYAACRPMTTPTAVTIFRWLYLSVSDWQPILENRSDPLQHSRAIREIQNHI